MKFDAPTSAFNTPTLVFGRAEQSAPRNVGPTTKAGRRLLRSAQIASELLPDIPEPGETVHALMLGFYDLCQVLCATLERLPACGHLRIATLCFSKKNAAELLGVMDRRRGTPFRFTMLVSDFFKRHNKELYREFRDNLAGYPDARISSARSHAKVALFDLGPGDGLAVESSANLRTNRNREQLTAVRDGALHAWHAEWIDQLVRG